MNAGHNRSRIKAWWGRVSGDTFTRALALVSLAVSLLSLTWAVWSSHRLETVARYEKRTAAVAALSALRSGFARQELEGELAIETMHRSRQYTICSNRKGFDRLVSKLDEQVQLAKDGQKDEEAHLAEIWPAPSPAPPSLERLEAIKAYAAHRQSIVEDIHVLLQSSLELLKMLGTTPIPCP